MYYHIFIFLIYFWATPLPLWATPSDTEEPLPEIHLIIEQPKTDEYSLAHPIDLQDKILHLLQPEAEQKTSLLEFLGKLSHRDLKQLYENLYSLLQAIENNQPIKATTLANGTPFDAGGYSMLTNMTKKFIENVLCQHQNIILPEPWQTPPSIPYHMARNVTEHENVIAPPPQAAIMARQHQHEHEHEHEHEHDNASPTSHCHCCHSIGQYCARCYHQVNEGIYNDDNERCMRYSCYLASYSSTAVLCMLGYQDFGIFTLLPACILYFTLPEFCEEL